MPFSFVNHTVNGYYPPLFYVPPGLGSLRTSLNRHVESRVLSFANLIIRSLFYPFNLLFAAVTAVGSVLVALGATIGWVFGGFRNKTYSTKTVELVQNALIRTAWLIADPFAFAWNQLCLFAGIFSATIAENTMRKLSLNSVFTWLAPWKLPHTATLAVECDLHKSNQMRKILAEPLEAILFAIAYKRSNQSIEAQYHINPEKLNQDQLKEKPIVLMTEDNSLSVWLPLLQYLQAKNYKGPIFAVNSAGSRNYFDGSSYQTMQRVLKVYHAAGKQDNDVGAVVLCHGQSHVRLEDFANLDDSMSNEENGSTKQASIASSIGKRVLVGSRQSFTNKKFRIATEDRTIIDALYDVVGMHKVIEDRAGLPFEGKENNANKDQDVRVNTGALGLVSHPETLERCYQAIKMR